MDPVLNFVDGSFLPANTGLTLETINPATGAVLTTLPRSDQTDVDNATKAAMAAAPKWASTPIDERIRWLQRLADALEEEAETVAQLESMDTGKPISLARRVDATRSVANFRFFAEHGLRHEDVTFVSNRATNHVYRKPVGVVGLITPWNLPLYLLTWKVAPALLMGNTIVAKPSELTPLTANHLAKVMDRIGFPPGVFNLVHGLGPEVGQAIVEHADIRAISFTGGTATGKIVAATAAPLFKKISLELGGKNATIVLKDAPLDEMMEGIVRASFTNSGQVCLCGSRLLVDASIYGAFREKFVAAVEGIVVGDPQNETTVMGSVISKEHQAKVESYIDLGIEEGGVVLTGGKACDAPVQGVPASAAFLRPTVFEGLSHKARTAREEIFGPVVTLHSFQTEEEAIDIANATQYGLAGSVWTGDVERGHAFAQRLETGIVWVNTWLNRDLRTPFGGVKDSGVGREGGDWSMNFFSELTNICVQQP